MNEDAHAGLQDLVKNRHGLVTIAGIIVCVLLALVAGGSLLFGLVMGAVYTSGLRLGRLVSTQISENAPAENITPAKIVGPVVAAVVVGIITAIILAAIQDAVDVTPLAGDDAIATIVKSVFDSAAALALAAGVVVGGWAHGFTPSPQPPSPAS